MFLRIVPLCLLSIAIGCAIRGTGGGPVDVPDDDNGQSGPAGSSNGFDNSAHILLTTLLVDNAGGATENTGSNQDLGLSRTPNSKGEIDYSKCPNFSHIEFHCSGKTACPASQKFFGNWSGQASGAVQVEVIISQCGISYGDGIASLQLFGADGVTIQDRTYDEVSLSYPLFIETDPDKKEKFQLQFGLLNESSMVFTLTRDDGRQVEIYTLTRSE